MKSLFKALALFLVLATAVSLSLAGSILCVHNVLKKDNMMQIVDQYMSSESDTDSVYQILDAGDVNGINAVMMNDNLSAIMNYYGSIADMTALSDAGGTEVSQMGGGLSGLLSGFGTMVKIVKGEYGLVSLMLNLVDAKTYLTTEVIDRALSAGNPAQDDPAPELTESVPPDESEADPTDAPDNENARKSAFLHTKLASHMTLEAAYVYYDYFRSETTAEDWQERLRASLDARLDEREQDLSFLIGHAITDEDRPLVDSLKTALTDAMIANMTPPEDKAASLSAGTRLFLNLFFANGIVVTMFVFALILLALIFVISHNEGNGTLNFGLIFLFSGAILFVLRFMTNFVIGPFYTDSGVGVMSSFAVVGVLFVAIGLAIFLAPGIIRKIRHRKVAKGSGSDTTVPSFGEIRAISEMGLGELVMNENNQRRREDGLIDYYDDGRGLDAQREYQKRKNGTPSDGGDPPKTS